MTADPEPRRVIPDRAAPPTRGGVALRRIGLDSRAYRDMLDDYCCWRLGLHPDLPADADLRDAILETAGHRFAFVAFLAERCQRGKEDADSLRRAPRPATADGTPPGAGDRPETDSPRGESLYRHWLAGLHLEYGHKLAERMRAVLALLCAAEAAHTWVFGAGPLAHPVTDAALTPLPERFEGLPLAVLQTLLLLEPPPRPLPAAGPGDADPPGTAPDRPAADRYNPALLLTLQQLQGVLSVHRGGSGISRFRIGLKDLGPALKHDAHVGPLLERAPARMASAALDAVEAIAEILDGTPDATDDRPGPRPSRHPDWPLFEALAPLLEALVVADGSETVERRWGQLRETAERLLQAEHYELEREGRTDLRLPGLTLLTAWCAHEWGRRAGAAPADALDSANDFAGSLSERGLAHGEYSDFVNAIADLNAAVKIRVGIRDDLHAAGREADWSVSYRRDLAAALGNRGNAYQRNGDLASAIVDYDAAVEIAQGIRDGLRTSGGEAAWSTQRRHEFAGLLQSRGNAHRLSGNLAAAIADFTDSVKIAEGIREGVRVAGETWNILDRSQLAEVLQNRGIAWRAKGDLAAAIADYDAAVKIAAGIRDILLAVGGEAAWSIPYRNDFTGMLKNRGNAHSDNGDQAAAFADYDASVKVSEGIRDSLRAAGGEAAWSILYRNHLALMLQGRGGSHQISGNLAAAIADYDASVKIKEGIRDSLRTADDDSAWPVAYRNELAGLLLNRGVAHQFNGDRAAAIADCEAAMVIGVEIRDHLRDRGREQDWSPEQREVLARIHAGRAMALGPTRGSQDLLIALEMAHELVRLGFHGPARQVSGFCGLVKMVWAKEAKTNSGGTDIFFKQYSFFIRLRKRAPFVYWPMMAVLVVIGLVRLPIILALHGLRLLWRRIARLGANTFGGPSR